MNMYFKLVLFLKFNTNKNILGKRTNRRKSSESTKYLNKKTRDTGRREI